MWLKIFDLLSSRFPLNPKHLGFRAKDPWGLRFLIYGLLWSQQVDCSELGLGQTALDRELRIRI